MTVFESLTTPPLTLPGIHTRVSPAITLLLEDCNTEYV